MRAVKKKEKITNVLIRYNVADTLRVFSKAMHDDIISDVVPTAEGLSSFWDHRMADL